MKVRLSAKQVSLVVVTLGAVALIVASVLRARDPAKTNHAPRSYPALFEEAHPCPGRGTPLEAGIRAEEAARFRADRYPYDPRDGVRAVLGYRTASSCYEAAGRAADAERAGFVGQELADRIATDYAAARLSLAKAVKAERWTEVLRETRHLQLLTSHLEGHEYVEWLRDLAGKATARHHGSS